MTELKTLKDCYMSDSRNFEQVLKEEAIEWVKYYQPQEDEDMSTYDTCNLKVVKFIREFFNITGEDLK